MTTQHILLLLINGVSLSIVTGLIFVNLIQPGRSAANVGFALVLGLLGVWAYFAMARLIDDMSPLDETGDFYVIFSCLVFVPVALYAFVIAISQPRDGIAPALLAWGAAFSVVVVILVWRDHVVNYRETGGDRVEFNFETAGIVVAVHLAAYLLLSYLYLHISKNPDIKPLRLPVILVMLAYAKNLVPGLRLPPLSIALLAAAMLLIGHYLLRRQLFNPLREVGEELRVANGDLRQALADLGEQKARVGKLEDELRDVTRYRSEFLNNMGYQLRTPLNSIVGYSALLLDGTYGEMNERQTDRIDKIHRNSIALLSVINDILDLSKIEGGRMALNLAPVRVGSVVGSTLDTLRSEADARSLALESRLQTPLRLVLADEERIQQIVRHLLQNALKFTPAGRVLVEAQNVSVRDGQSVEFKLPVLGWLEDRAWVVLNVTDTGIGIPPEEQAAIFEDFRRGSNAAGAEIEGSGLGLAIARRLTELHGGRLWVRSRVQEGSTFYIALPALDGLEE